jgi:hypothetical protein
VLVSARPTAHALVGESAHKTLWNGVRLGLGTDAQVAADAGDATDSTATPINAEDNTRRVPLRRRGGLSDRMVRSSIANTTL